jgi:hypothetical protein
MTDHICDTISDDAHLSATVRAFLSTPAIARLLNQVVEDHVTRIIDEKLAESLRDSNALRSVIHDSLDYGEIAASLDMAEIASHIREQDLASNIDLECLAEHIEIDTDTLVDSLDYRSLATNLLRSIRS